MKIKRKLLRVKRLILRDKIILGDIERKSEKNKVNLHWYSLKRADRKENFGDYLSVVIVKSLMEKYKISEEYVSKRKHLYAIGSILGMGGQNAVIWGSRTN